MAAQQSLVKAHAPRSASKESRRAIVAGTVGNTMEWYDFAVYAYLTPVISRLFFPGDDPVLAVLSTFAIFAVGFLMRPVGAVFFGWYADKIGRKQALVASVTLMGVATICLGLIPTYFQAGLVATVLLTVCRLAQGLSLGGEYGTSTSFLVEYAPQGKRGLYGSLAYFSSILGMGIGAIVVLLLNLFLSSEAMDGWGWRVAFLLSFPLLAFGTYVRVRIGETPEFKKSREASNGAKTPLSRIFRDHWRSMLNVVGVGLGFAISTYVVVSFILTFLQTTVGVEPTPAILTVVVTTLFGAALIPVFGWLSDKYGRKPVLVAACLACMVFPILGFFVVITGSLTAVVIGQLLMWIPVSIFGGVVPSAYAEMFPTDVRVSAFGIAYAIATAVFSGTAPFVATFLVEVTGNVVSPGWYITVAGFISLFFVVRLRETSREELLASNSQSEAMRASAAEADAAASGPAGQTDPKIRVEP